MLITVYHKNSDGTIFTLLHRPFLRATAASGR